MSDSVFFRQLAIHRCHIKVVKFGNLGSLKSIIIRFGIFHSVASRTAKRLGVLGSFTCESDRNIP